jgi:SNF2 family DNA or RNA helicase
MLISPKHKKILLNLREPERVTSIIPRSRVVNVQGRDIVAVEHGLDESRVLRNIGIHVPSPVRYYYDWPGIYKPYAHQEETVDFLTMNPRSFCLNDMGTGKSVSVLWAYDWLKSIGAVNKLLIISPLSTLERAWGDEIFRHFPERSVGVLHGTAQHRVDVLAQDHDIYLINHDGIKNKNLLKLLVEREEIDIIVVDEIASFRNSSTERWKALRAITRPRHWVWGLTGTPIPNEPTDAWAQIKIINPDGGTKFYGTFRDSVMKQLSQFKWVARPGALDIVRAAMRPAIRYDRADCIDLPPTTYADRHVALSTEQSALYKQMLQKFKAEFEGGQITALNEAVRVNKLLQICVGVAYSEEGDVEIPSPGRVEALKEVIEEAGGKVIVFVPFTGALKAVAAKLAEDYTVGVIHGETSKPARDDILGNFQNSDGAPRVLVANPGTMSHGLTLTAASVIVWFSPIHSAEIYEQANARIVRPGQKRNTLIVRMEGSDLERRMYDKLQTRTKVQGTLLSMFEK